MKLNRRQFLGSAALASTVSIVPRHVLGGPGYVAPNDRITLAHIGLGTQSVREIQGLLDDPRIQIVAVCDPNRDSQDYVEWGKNNIRNRIRDLLGDAAWREGRQGCPGGREVGREIVEGYYAKRRGKEAYKGCKLYADYRDLLANEPDVDAVKIMTPDHLHATLSIAAMNQGKHVLMHKPIANRLQEGRMVLDTLRRTQVATHLLAYGSGAGNGRIAALVKDGVIGRLREIHNWTNRPVWPQYPGIPEDRPAVPDGFDWDLWLGPEQDRPYHPHYTHTVYRGWYDFGGGSMADMGIYSLWPVFTALNLGTPTAAEAWATHTCAIRDHVSGPSRNDAAYPLASMQRFAMPAAPGRPELDLFWYDGGMKPRLPREVEVLGVELGREGILFLGDEGSILAGFHGQDPMVYSGGGREPLSQAAGEARTGGDRSNPWLEACTGGDPSPGSFLNAAAITDTVNLGTVALRAGRKVTFDSQAMRITNDDGANRFLVRRYRKGWALT